jgi:hypothetical protein
MQLVWASLYLKHGQTPTPLQFGLSQGDAQCDIDIVSRKAGSITPNGPGKWVIRITLRTDISGKRITRAKTITGTKKRGSISPGKAHYRESSPE